MAKGFTLVPLVTLVPIDRPPRFGGQRGQGRLAPGGHARPPAPDLKKGPTVKTLYAPDTAAALADLAQGFLVANPVAGFALVTLACAAFAAWAKDSAF